MNGLACRIMLVAFCLCWGIAPAWSVEPKDDRAGEAGGRMWDDLLAGAARLHLPTGFLARIPPAFIQFEFDDLRTYAAEYHPSEHRMVLNRSLSFNAAGRTLRPLSKMTAKELEVLYHELFHAYIDFLVSQEGDQTAPPDPLLMFARAQQDCRYREVTITPVVQRSQETESRYLTDNEAWEALNETWAVFIGWAVWNQLEVEKNGGGSILQHRRQTKRWLDRLQHAVQKGELRGYYVPEDPEERRVAQKRFLAPDDQLSLREMTTLMKQVLGLSEQFIDHAGKNFNRMKSPAWEQRCGGMQP